MKKLAILTLAAAALFAATGAATITPAQAQGVGIYVGPRNYDDRPRYYDDGPRYRRYERQRYYREGRREYRGGYRTRNGCRPGFTVQDGVCKPYRGY